MLFPSEASWVLDPSHHERLTHVAILGQALLVLLIALYTEAS